MLILVSWSRDWFCKKIIMANNRPSDAEPENLIDMNFNTTSSSSPWTNLPLEVHYVLGSAVDSAGLCNMRLVCTKWKQSVEQSVGLKVRVDDSIEGNLEFVKRMKVESARIINWTVNIVAEPASHLFQYPNWLKKLKLCGKMPAQWKIHDLHQFPSLAHLVLRDRALYSNNLTGHQYLVFTFDPTSELSPDEMLRQAFKIQDLPSEAHPIEFKSLQKLEIIRCEYTWADRLKNHSLLLMLVNIRFILRHVTSPLLSVVHLTASIPENVRASPHEVNWTLFPLHRFLDNHRTSLRQLFLPRFEGQSLLLFQHEALSNSFPINLQKLMLSLYGKNRDFGGLQELDLTTFRYLNKCLEGQTQLQDVSCDFTSFPLQWTTDAFTSFANSCSSTLRYLKLQGNTDGNTGSLDLELLSACHKLEVLHLHMEHPRPILFLHNEPIRTMVTFRNVDKLPVSLKRVVILCSDWETPQIGDPRFLERLIALEWLYLNNIRLPNDPDNDSEDQELERQFCRTMIKGLLGLRQLQGYHVGVQGFGLNTDGSLVKMLGSLDERINPTDRSPQSTTRFNLSWPYLRSRETPWSDKLFDTREWDMERY